MEHTPTLSGHVRVLVIGAGFGGLGTAIKLQEKGERDFLVLEKAGDVGGTWRDNTYPGAACDVPSQLYSFSFALNPDWSQTYSPQPEIQAYIQRVADRSGVLDRFRFNTNVEDARWDTGQLLWRIRTSSGDLTASILVVAAGSLSEPKLPDIDGIDSFDGALFHSARWNHDFDLTGKRVAVIGTGASAIQIVPEVAEKAARLDVYQRTAPWVMPRAQRPYTRFEKLLFRYVPGAQRLARTGIYWLLETFVRPALTVSPLLGAPLRKAATANLNRGVSDPELRQRVLPNFSIGCKRILFSNDWYPALSRDNVDLVTDPIVKVTPNAVVTEDGTEREVDALIVATGFHTTDLPIATHIVGTSGETLSEHFAEGGMQAYKGATVHGFPNMFFVVGPNTGLGHSSMVFMIESQVAYLVDAVTKLRQHELASVQPTVTAQQTWVEDVQRRMKKTVWSTGGCQSWYLDDHGRNVSLWPRSTFAFRKLTASFDLDAYDATPYSQVAAATQDQKEIA
jgi:cation diffusion facilitator CzcD-associated flavoprotein CzcO